MFSFKEFNPLLDKVPNYPIPLERIAYRARLLLKFRTIEQITQLVDYMEWMIEDHFSFLELEDIDVDYHELVDDQEGDCSAEYRDFQFDYVTVSINNRVEVLKEHIYSWADIDLDETPNLLIAEPYEYFAVLALWEIFEAMQLLENGIGFSCDDMDTAMYQLFLAAKPLSGNKHYCTSALSIAYDISLKAMDALCYAERLKELTGIENNHLSIAQQFLAQEKKQQDDGQKKKMAKASIARHAIRNETVLWVTTEWEKDPYKFPSAAKAGVYFSDMLINKGLKGEPRTVTKWILAHAKEIGVRF